jgi:hypothetical protein
MLSFIMEKDFEKAKSDFDKQQLRIESWKNKKPDVPFEEDLIEEPIHWHKRIMQWFVYSQMTVANEVAQRDRYFQLK